MRNAILFVTAFLATFTFSQYVHNTHAEEIKKPELACIKNSDLEKIMNDKGYMLLLNMSLVDNKDNVVETIWIGGENIAITAAVKDGDTSCFIANMEHVIVNPQSIEAIWENYKKQTKQKDI